MTSFIPQPVQVQRYDNGEIVEVPDVTIIAWASATKLEAETGLTCGRRAATAIVKQTLGLPRNMRKAEVAEICANLKDQMFMYAGVDEDGQV